MGTLFRVSTFGESHGGAVGAVVDGCPPRMELNEADVQRQLDRRRPGRSRLTSPRREPDRVRILSGVFEGRTLGTPILLLVENADARPSAYESMRELYRPSHADFTYDAKYGIRAWAGGGRASARETVGRVAAGAIAEKILRLGAGVEIVAWVRRVGATEAEAVDPASVTREQVDAHEVRCPDPAAASRMAEAIDAARRDGDSLGGIVEAVARGVPAGLGEPVFEKLEAELARALLGIPACKGFESGSGLGSALLRGSEHNDAFVSRRGRIGTATNRSGGIQGGIANGEPIVVRAAFKPTATIRKPQRTVDVHGRPAVLEAQGRHDPCVLPRAVPIVESMLALVLVDAWMRQLALESAAARLEPSAAPGRPRRTRPSRSRS